MEDSQTQLVHSFPKGQDEEIQMSIRKYKGRLYIDLRVWFMSKSAQSMRPTKKGVFIPFDQLPQLRKGVDELAQNADRFSESGE